MCIRDRYRGGQRAMAAGVYRTLRDGQRLLCQAPTGIGKTMSTLFPALKAMGEGCDGRILDVYKRQAWGRATRPISICAAPTFLAVRCAFPAATPPAAGSATMPTI